jgi:hypothetical protein
MRRILTKLGIFIGLAGALSLSAASPTLAKLHRPATSSDTAAYDYTCEGSWFYAGYYCYQPSAYYQYYGYPWYYAYGSSYPCTGVTWNGWQWVRTRAC